jgi:lipoyl(octanoyl) transferase
MQDFTAARTEHSPDQIWVLQHPSVFTLGHAGRPEHLLAPGSTPVIHVDRGGQITWHGPGQCVVYLMLDLRRLGYGVRELVGRMERAVIATLSGYEIEARARADAPGVYVEDAKIASLGLKVKRGRSYHGLALNVDCSLDDFARINPCGYSGLAVTRMQDVLGQRCPAIETVGAELVSQLGIALGFAQESIQPMEWQHG